MLFGRRDNTAGADGLSTIIHQLYWFAHRLFLLFRSLTSFSFHNIECGDRYCPPKGLLSPYRLFDLRVMRILCRIACFGDRGERQTDRCIFVFGVYNCS